MKKLLFFITIGLVLLLVGCSKQLTITFETNGADAIEAMIVEKGSELELPTVVRTGYNFLGWFTNEALTEAFDYGVIERDLTLYAKWEIKKFTVVFKNYDDAILLTLSNVEYGSNVTAPTNPEREGYTFTGWDKSLQNITANTTIMAQFAIKIYSVQFYDFEENTLGEVQTVAHGAAAVAPTNIERAGYAFLGWDVAFDEVIGDLDVYPLYERLTYTVEFQDYNGTRIGDVQTINYGEDATAPSNPTRLGYIFDGWDRVFTNVTSNLIVKAKYILHEYAIDYYDGATKLEHLPDTFTIDIAKSLADYEKQGFIFDGWFKDSALTEKITFIPAGTSSDIVVYGKWLDMSLTYNIEYELNGGSWTWTTGTVTAPANGIAAVSNLPDTLLLDYYMYLKTNNLLESSIVHTSLHKTSWATFKQNYNDPVAIYNHTSSNTSANNNGYSQFFYTTATGDPATHRILTIDGGFFGTEPYKTKYANLVQHLSLLLFLRGYNTEFWMTASSKSLGGFVLDGYFYGTQGLRSGDFDLLRASIPNTNKMIVIQGGVAVEQETPYQITSFVQGTEAKLVSPIKSGHFFAGWFDNSEFSGEPIALIAAGQAPAAKYYAKWIPQAEIE